MGQASQDVQREHKRVAELLESFDTAMFVTRDGEALHARPMAVAGVDGDRAIWFVTSISPKTEELEKDPRVSVTLQSPKRFVALSGRGKLVRDRAKLEELWKPDWKIWFPNGKDDPSVILIHVDVDDVEYWDNRGAKGARYMFEAAKALVKGDKPGSVAGAHGRVKSA